MSNATLGPIKRRNGVAGQIAYTVTATYPGESPTEATFVGSAYGGPVVMLLPPNVETFVTDPYRFGAFSPEWVRRFFADA